MNTFSPVAGVAIPSLGDAESLRLAARMLEHAQAMAATRELDDFATSGWLPDDFFETLEHLYGTYDAYIEHNIDASQLKIMCRVACARCCHQHVYSTFTFEIINLYRQLRGRANYVTLFRALLANGQEFESMLAGYLQNSDGRRDLAVVNTLQHLAALAKPCPLLAGNRCGVYEHRPMSCRMYHSLSNPVLCTTVVGRTFHLVPPEEVMKVLAAINGRLLFSHCEYLAQGFVAFAALREHRPWEKPRLAGG
jgi:Fe-S-cluster containining protein